MAGSGSSYLCSLLKSWRTLENRGVRMCELCWQRRRTSTRTAMWRASVASFQNECRQCWTPKAIALQSDLTLYVTGLKKKKHRCARSMTSHLSGLGGGYCPPKQLWPVGLDPVDVHCAVDGGRVASASGGWPCRCTLCGGWRAHVASQGHSGLRHCAAVWAASIS